MGKNTIQNDGPFVACYNMRAVTFVLADEMADVSIAGLQRFILIRRLNHTGSHRPFQTPFTSRKKKYTRFGTRITNLLQSYELRGKQSSVSHFSRILRHAIEKGRGPMLYTKKPGPHGTRTFL